MENKADNHLKGKPPVPQEDDFAITQALAYMQRGLSSSYDYSDLVYVIDEPIKSGDKLKSQFEGLNYNSFRQKLAILYSQNFTQNSVPEKDYDLKKLTAHQLLIASFDTEFWNQLNINPIDVYKPSWLLEPGKRLNNVAQNLPGRKKDFYKFNIKIFFQIKKMKRGNNPFTKKAQEFLKSFGLKFYTLQSESKQFCGVAHAIVAGRFNDGLQKPKDPYTFFLHCLLGYKQPQHVGGSFLIVQKSRFDWFNIHVSSESLPIVMGRNDIKNGSTIFSQNHCPRSHIRLSRIKDDQGNTVTMHRQSKTYTSKDFQPLLQRGTTDNINPQQGLFFLAYHNNPKLIQKMMLNQLGNNDNPAYEDGLLNHFNNEHGGILYTPNVFEITGLTMSNPDVNPKISDLCRYHQTRWLKDYKKNEEDEQNYKVSGNTHFLYSRAGFMKKMSYSHDYQQQLNPPSPRVMRLLSKTFSLWQDTWYFDRSQREFPHLTFFLENHKDVLQQISVKSGFDFNQFKKYQDYPMVIRNGLAIHFNLGYVVSTYQYGCRGPSKASPHGKFGAGTFHLQPEDLLAGGGANLSFGQGKYLIQYLTNEQMREGFLGGRNLSAYSGVGHVNFYSEQIMTIGLDKLIQQFKAKAEQFKGNNTKKYHLFISTIFALLGMQKYFINYSNLAQKQLKQLAPKQVASAQSYTLIRDTMAHLAHYPPIPINNQVKDQKASIKSLYQGAQLILSTYFCLQLTGEQISLGRLDYSLRNFATPITQQNYQPSQQVQDIIDCLWIKVGEKANFNKAFFEDHQKWGNLAMGGNSNPFPQGASFNQWGQQLVVGGSNPDNTPFHNSVTIACIRAARRIPVNAPCLGLRVHKNTPKFIIQEATKAVLAGGGHPVLLNDDKVIPALERCGDYVIKKQLWDSQPLEINGKTVDVPYENWNTLIKLEDRYDYGSDGCHQFLPVGKTWFWLGGVCSLQPLQYVLNQGKSLISSGPRFIHGQRQTYRWKKLEQYKTYQQLENQYFQNFEESIIRGFTGQLYGFQNISTVCPATLLNAFTADMRKRESDFYQNGATYKLFAPQFSGIANLTNALWNIKTLVYEQKVTTLQQIRGVLLVNWGDQLQEPFVPRTLPAIMKTRLKQRCETLREVVWKQPKFGLDPEVTAFGLRLSKRMSRLARKVFEEPRPAMLNLMKTLTYKYATKDAPFGFQYVPGCGTFENYADMGAGIGASFDGRKKAQPLAEDFAPQNFLNDINVRDPRYEIKPLYLADILDNYTYEPDLTNSKNSNEFTKKDPELLSGAIVDFNIDQDYKRQVLINDIEKFAKGAGPNAITISSGSRKLLQEALLNTDRDLLRFRHGGWSQFAVAMFPHLLEHHIRRVRSIPAPPKKNAKPPVKKDDPNKVEVVVITK